MRRRYLLAAALLALGACHREPATNSAGPANALAAPSKAATAAPAATSPRLAKIFTPDILGANVAYLETITGPAFRTDGSDLTYKVDGCTIIVGATGGKIDNIGIENYGPACHFPIAQYFAGGYQHPTPDLPTFGDLQQGLGGDYGADCLKLCGNAADPQVWIHHEGSHADNFNDLVASVPVVDDPVVNAYAAWADKLGAKNSDAALEQGTAGLSDTMQDVAAPLFAPLRPTTIRVGSKLPASGN